MNEVRGIVEFITSGLGLFIGTLLIPWVQLLLVWFVGRWVLSMDRIKRWYAPVYSWIGRHTSIVWIASYILILVVAFSMTKVVNDLPDMTMPESSPTSITITAPDGTSIVHTLPGVKMVTDETATHNRELNVCLLWFWPIYFIWTYKVTKWVLDTKGIKHKWLWAAMLILPLVPLMYTDKKGIHANS